VEKAKQPVFRADLHLTPVFPKELGWSLLFCPAPVCPRVADPTTSPASSLHTPSASSEMKGNYCYESLLNQMEK